MVKSLIVKLTADPFKKVMKMVKGLIVQLTTDPFKKRVKGPIRKLMADPLAELEIDGLQLTQDYHQAGEALGARA